MSARKVSCFCFSELKQLEHTLLITLSNSNHIVTHVPLFIDQKVSNKHKFASHNKYKEQIIEMLAADQESNVVILTQNEQRQQIEQLIEHLKDNIQDINQKHQKPQLTEKWDNEMLLQNLNSFSKSQEKQKSQAQLNDILQKMTEKVEKRLTFHNFRQKFEKIKQQIKIYQGKITKLNKIQQSKKEIDKNLRKKQKKNLKVCQKKLDSLNDKKGKIENILRQGQIKFIKDLSFKQLDKSEQSQMLLQSENAQG